MPINFILLPEEQATDHIERLKGKCGHQAPIEINFTDGVSQATVEIHERVQEILKNGRRPRKTRKILENLVGHVQGLDIKKLKTSLEEDNEEKIKEQIKRINSGLKPEEIRILVKNRIAILAGEEVLEIPKPSSSQTPNAIETFQDLKAKLREILETCLKDGYKPEDVIEMRKRLNRISTKNPIIDGIVKKLLTQTIFLVSKNGKPSISKEKLIAKFVAGVGTLIAEVRASQRRKIYTHKKDEGGDNLEPTEDVGEETTGILETSDFRLFGKKDRMPRASDWEDPKKPREERWVYDQEEYRPRPEDFEDRQEEPEDPDKNQR